jgi:hypothetical protein
MKKIAFSILATAAIVACNKPDTTSAASDGATTTTTSSAQTSTVSNVVNKALSFLGGGGPFEGEITMSITDPAKPPKTITYDVKGTKLRFDSPAEAGPMSGGYAIFDTQAKKMTMVDDAKKTAMVMDVGAMGTNPAAPTGPKPTVEKTGKSDTVAGYSCDIIKVTEANGDKADVCVAKGISFPAMGGRHSAGWMSSLEDSFPLRAITTDASGKEKSHMEVTKVDKKSIDDARFQVPAGYQTVSMEDMMKNLGGLRGAGNFRPPR